MGRKPDEERSVYLHMRISPSLKEQAQERADEEGRTLSNYVESLLLKDIKEHSN